MKVLVVAEGIHEMGACRIDDPTDERRGALQSLLQQLNSAIVDVTCLPITSKALDLEIQPGKGGGLFKRGMAILRYARKHGYDAAVVLIDEDGDLDRHRSFTQSQESTAFYFPRAFGIAVRAFDAWMLADEMALSKTMERTIDRRSSPEEIKDPKQEFRSLLDSATAINKSQAECYLEVATQTNLTLLEQRCPKGFKPFADRVRKLKSS